MPSTYSPNLRIELIANGEQSGTWGATTNSNLGTLIEDAISGYVSVSITSANQALTALNGAADQSRNMVINLTTTTTANFNVYIPPAEKVYIIRNASAYDATIYCSTVIGNTTAAGTGATIPAGRETLIFSDGTNVSLAVDYVSSLNLASPLPATSGGTGQSSYTVGDLLYANTSTTLTKLADVATGNALISGGVGVAPSYGKIGLATHVSGTLPTANGGTNLTSFTSGGAVYATSTSALTTGTLPVASGGTGATSLTANNVLLGNGTSAVQTVAPGTSGNVLTSNGTTWVSGTAFVTGMIMMWSGTIATIPSGWQLCNGTNGTPDLRDRFIVGASVDSGGQSVTTVTGANTKTGGSKDAVVVSHNHTATSSVTDPGHTHGTNAQFWNSPVTGAPDGYFPAFRGAQATINTATTGISVSTSVATTGSSGTNANLVPYYALAFIMKL
jgi:hypothetical protein